MIIIPDLTFHKALKFIKELDGLTIAEDEEFDFSKVHNCDPFPMLVVSAAIRKKRSESIEKTCRAINCQNTYAEHMRFYRAIGIDFGRNLSENYGNSNYLPITKLEISDLRNEGIKNTERIQEVLESKAKLMANVLSRGNDSFKKWLKYVLTEVMRNIPEHSKADAIWYCAQYWPSYDLVELGILDEGVGIRNSLLDNYAYHGTIRDDKEAIGMALSPGISKAFAPGSISLSKDEWANSGFGLFMVSQLCKELDGSFLIASGESAIRINNDVKLAHYPTNFKGTAIQIRIRPSMINNYEVIAKKILKRGEQLAKERGGGFETASKSTKSLFWDGG